MDIFYPKQPPADLKTLIKGSGLSFEKLKELVQDNELQVMFCLNMYWEASAVITSPWVR